MQNTEHQFTIRLAGAGDLRRIVQIICQAREQMRARGSLQWQGPYPAEADIERDIMKSCGYVLCCGGDAMAYAAVILDGEEAYDKIDGSWPSNDPYVVVHRLAVADEMKGRGAATCFMQKIANMAQELGISNFRVDTNFDNAPMLKILDRLNFTYCGEVRYDNSPRRAYHKHI